jgi:protein-disulfide isomerase
LIRPTIRFAGALVLAVLTLPVLQAVAQQDVPAAPDQDSTPSAPTPAVVPAFPKIIPANFTAASPTPQAVNDFLHASWGYDESRIWEVWAIQKTQAVGVSKVTLLVNDKTGKQKPTVVDFLVLSDGKHIVAQNDVLPFGEHPYAEMREIVKQRANGPYRGVAMKDLEIVEFADFQCPHCKEAQANMDKLLTDFPKARIVFQTFPLESIHPQAERAAAYGYCVNKQGGSDNFFTFVSAVFDGQEGLETADGATLTLNSAVTKTGLDPAKISDCAVLPETDAAVKEMVDFAIDLNINATPTLVVNGRQVPANAPYDTLKKIIQYQAKLDGVATQ